MRGRVENNAYTSPTETFRIRIPPLSSNIKFREEMPAPNTLFSITDDLCREFIVSERPGVLAEESLESWTETHIVQDLKSLGFDVQTKTVKTRYGTAGALRYRAPAAAPCTRVSDSAGTRVESKPDADVGWYVYHHAGAFYRLIYVVGLGPGLKSSWFIQREPVDEVLARFADGFESLSRRQSDLERTNSWRVGSRFSRGRCVAHISDSHRENRQRNDELQHHGAKRFKRIVGLGVQNEVRGIGNVIQ